MQNKLAKIEGTNFVYEFLYNSRNERIAIGKAVNGTEMTWRYDACNGPVCIAEFDESADVSTYFVRGSGIAQGIGDVIAEVNYNGTSEEIHYYLYNHRGDVVCVVNPGSTPNTTYRYDAYGKCYENLGSYTSRYTFSTKEYLPEADLYLYQYRVYDPQAGRWTQRDPIDYQDSINLYQFCGNNPINTFDFLGCDSVAFYDEKDESDSFWRADKKDFKREAEDYDHPIPISDPSEIPTELERLSNEGIEVTELHIIGHGRPGEQHINGKVVPFNNAQYSSQISVYLSEECVVTLHGCRVGYDLLEEGQKASRTLNQAATNLQRPIEAYDDYVFSWPFEWTFGKKNTYKPGPLLKPFSL